MSDPIKKPISLNVRNHPRLSEFNRLVYPVVSRRAGGLSLGINLNPKKTCSFNCVYCQVDRSHKIEHLQVNTQQILAELDEWLGKIQNNGGLFQGERLKDISIAGDGEPTLKKELPEVINQVIEQIKRYQFNQSKPILFTNGSKLDRDDLKAPLEKLYKSHGEIWFKLDFWDEKSYLRINRSNVAYKRILQNLKKIGQRFPLTLQSCFFSWDGQKFKSEDYLPYAELIKNLTREGVKIELIQSYTTARKPAESQVKPWSDQEMDALHGFFKSLLEIPIKTIYTNGVKNS